MPEPKVTIGVPVYNGARHIRGALSSLARQRYDNLEILVSDNCSTDETYELCVEAARADARIRVIRSETNVGAVANFNRVLQRADGDYFMWAAYDDERAPDYVRRCVAALEANPEAAAAQSYVRIIDENGELLDVVYRNALPPDADAVARFEAVLNTHWWTQVVYGLFRREHLVRTGGFSDLLGSDKLLVAEVAVTAPVVEVPEPLFDYRVDTRAAALPITRQSWYRASSANRSALLAKYPVLETCRAYLDIVRRAPLSAAQKALATAHVLRWYLVEMTVLPAASRLRAAFPVVGTVSAPMRAVVDRLRSRSVDRGQG